MAGKIVSIPKSVLSTLIVILATVGAYSISKSMFDVYQMYIAGILGYIMTKNNFPVSPVALALLLGSMLEKAISQTTVLYSQNFLMIFSRPMTIVFTALIVVSFAWPLVMTIIKKQKAKKGA